MPFKKGESGNRRGRPPRIVQPDGSTATLVRQPTSFLGRVRAAAAARMDGWINMITALGTWEDKRTHSWFAPDVIMQEEAQNLWRGDDICKRIIEAPPKAEFRRGITLNLQDKKLGEEVKTELEEMGIINKFVEARCWENAYGGCGMWPVTDDIESLSEPLDEDNINKIDAIHLFEPRELTPVVFNSDVHSPMFRQPEIWRLVPLNGGMIGLNTVYIHASRLIIFKGRRISNMVLAGQRPGWGDSKLTGVFPIVRDFGAAWGHVATLLQDFAQGVLQMDGYGDLMSTPEGEAIVEARLRMMDMKKSSLKSLVMDAKDKYSRDSSSLAGASDILRDMANRISAAAEQPVSVLFGMEPSGLNGSSDNSVRGWYDNVAADREHHTKPKLEHFIRLFLKSKDGPTGGKEPDVWSASFPPLWEPTEKERADTRLAVAQADQIYAVNIGACTPDDVAESRWQGDTYSAEMTIDWARRKKQQAADAQMAKEQHDAQVAALAAPKPPLSLAPGDPNADETAVAVAKKAAPADEPAVEPAVKPPAKATRTDQAPRFEYSDRVVLLAAANDGKLASVLVAREGTPPTYDIKCDDVRVGVNGVLMGIPETLLSHFTRDGHE